MPSAHSLANVMRMTSATPMLLITWVLFCLLMMQVCCYDRMQKWGFVISQQTMEVDENLPNFFNSVKLSDS